MAEKVTEDTSSAANDLWASTMEGSTILLVPSTHLYKFILKNCYKNVLNDMRHETECEFNIMNIWLTKKLILVLLRINTVQATPLC